MSPSSDILSANLRELGRNAPALADRLRRAAPAELIWADSRAGPPWAAIVHDGKTLALASRYDPVAEAAKLAGVVDHQKHAGIIVLGMGLGYHAARIASTMKGGGVMVVFEPNLAVLRAVLERIDHTGWLGWPNVVIADAQTDRAALLSRIEKFSATLTQGTVLVGHPPSRQMHGDAMAEFGRMVTDVLAYCRTNVATALVNASRTCSNLAVNLPYYVAGATTNELLNAAKGYPAVCVGAGPSLAKNVQLLCDPKVRRNIVLISAQTTLKPLLDRGIKPDFVTALDYAEISKRFYEDLPAAPGLDGVTLVAEPKAHPAILDSFGGPIRVCQSRFLDKLLGDLAPPIKPIKDGATVAHLSFYLGQHLGCDPIIFIGQDLGFSDGLYYCPGTAIDQVWAPELGPFNTVEMMQWQRIVRHRCHLRKLDDIHGQPIYTEEQMLTYLKQFERDFAEAPQTVLDATEGGLPKQHTTRITFAEALQQHATRPVPQLPIAHRTFDIDRLAAASDRLVQLIAQVQELRRLTRKTLPILRQMIEHRRDRVRMRKLFDKLESVQRKVHGELGTTFQLVNDLNVVAAFKRARADRAIHHAHADGYARQGEQIERDLENLEWLLEACDEALTIFRRAEDRVEQSLKDTRPDAQNQSKIRNPKSKIRNHPCPTP